jgi:hypothetical protein
MADHPLLGLQWQVSMLGLAHNHDVSREQLNTADALRQCKLHEPSPGAHIVHFVDGIDMPRAHTGVHIINAGGFDEDHLADISLSHRKDFSDERWRGVIAGRVDDVHSSGRQSSRDVRPIGATKLCHLASFERCS